MKKTLLFLSFIFAVFFVTAQCTPDAQYTSAGIYPDTAMGLSNSIVGQAYTELITIIAPLDTSVDYPPFGTINVTVDNIDLTSVTGLPANFDYQCDPPNCSFPGGFTSCAILYSTSSPDASQIGIYPITFETTTYVSDVPIINTITQDDVTSGYYLEITDNTTSTIGQYNYNSFELRDPVPNPSSGYTKIQFISKGDSNILFTIYDLIGKKVDSRLIVSEKGVNTIDLNTDHLEEGMYMYSISNGTSVLTKRMIITD